MDRVAKQASRRDFIRAAGALGATALAAGCSGASGGNLSAAGKAVKGGPKTTPNPDVHYPPDYLGPIASFKGPITTERARLRVVVAQDPIVGDWKKNEFSRWLEKRTNVHVDWEVVAGGDDTMTKVNAMLASGDLPDVLMVDFTPSQLLLFGRDQQLFIPLDDLIENYGVEIKRVFKQYPVAREVCTGPDGKIYSLPNVNDCFHCHVGARKAWIYRPWLDELGMAVPESTDELEEVLKAFKSKDPNGNGKNDEIPFIADVDTPLDDFFMSGFLYNPGEPWLVLEDGKAEAAFRKPEWREGLAYMHRLGTQGLISPETFTQSNDQLLRQGNSTTPILGATKNNYWGGYLTIQASNPHARFLDYVPIPALKGPNGDRVMAWDYYSSVAVPGSFVITRSSKIPEIALMWGDAQYELEAILRSYSGVKDKDWQWATPGRTGINGKPAIFEFLSTLAQSSGTNWNQQGIQYRSDDFRLGQAVRKRLPTFEATLYERTKEAYFPYRQPKRDQFPPLYMSFDAAGAIADMSTTINGYVSQQTAKFTLGKSDPRDSGAWQDYLDTLDAMGIVEYLKIYQQQYDAFLQHE